MLKFVHRCFNVTNIPKTFYVFSILLSSAHLHKKHVLVVNDDNNDVTTSFLRSCNRADDVRTSHFQDRAAPVEPSKHN